MAAVAGIGGYLWLSHFAQLEGLLESSFVKAVLLNGLGIYIFSDPLNYVIAPGPSTVGTSWRAVLGGLVLMILRLVITGLAAYY